MTTHVDLSGASWHKSSYSNGSGGNCVEVATGVPGAVPVRDSKHDDGTGPLLLITAGGWSAFVTAVKGGRL